MPGCRSWERSSAEHLRERGLRDVDGDLEQLEEYRAQVLGELERRADRVKRIDSEIAATDFRLENLAAQRSAAGGETGRLLAQVAYRAKVKRDRARLQEQRAEAADDLRSAMQRLEQVDSQIAQLGGDAEGDEVSDGEKGK